MLLAGCNDGPTDPTPRDAVPVVSEFVDEPGVYRTSERWRFEGGLTVWDVRVEPDNPKPGQQVAVSLQYAGVRGEVSAVVSLAPPHAASRQVALGGVDAPKPHLAPDRRTSVVEATLDGEAGGAQLSVPLSSPWHPQQATVTLELLAGGTRVHVTDGPRTDDGVAMLGLVAVQTQPMHVVAQHVDVAPAIDGVLSDGAWQDAGTTLVESRQGEPWSGKAGAVAFAWDDTNLYAAASFVDRDVWATMTEHDQPLWKEEVFELFVFGEAPAKRYLELQVSPRGVTFDSKFATYRKGDTTWNSAWQTAVELKGTLDNRKDRDEGWSVEVAVPWSEICTLTPTPCPPQPGTTLRINAFRFERPAKGGAVGLALSPTRVPDFHAADNAAVLELGR